MRYVAFMLVTGTCVLALFVGAFAVEATHNSLPTPTQVSVR